MTDDRQGQDERISAIRAAHYPWSPYGDDPFCPKCLDDNNESSWPCDYGYVLTRLDALAAERDGLARRLDLFDPPIMRLQDAAQRAEAAEAERDHVAMLREGDHAWARLAVDNLKAERDDALARLAAAEAALERVEWKLDTAHLGLDREGPQYRKIIEAREIARAALAGSREQAQGEGA